MRVIDGAGREFDAGPAKRQLVLAALLMDAGRLVTVDALVDRGWGDAPPPQVAGVLRAHLSRIRTQLALVRSGGAQPAELCGGFPLALRIAAARLLADPARSVPSLVSELAGQHRLSGLDVEHGDVAVRRAFDLSSRRLPPAVARAFRLLSPVPATGDGLGLPATAALLGLDEPATRGPSICSPTCTWSRAVRTAGTTCTT